MRALISWFPLIFRRRRRLRDEVLEELRVHVEMHEQECRDNGMTAAEARAEALRRLGDARQIADDCVRVHDDHPVRATVRAVEAVATLSVAIGLATALFLLTNAVLFRAPVAFHDDANRVALWWQLPDGQGFSTGSSDGEFARVRNATDVFEHATAAAYKLVTVSGPQGSQAARSKYVSRDYFRLFGAQPVVGRLFESGEEERDDARVTVVSHDLWQRQFQGRRDAIGAELQIDGVPFTVVGIMPANLPMYLETALFLPLAKSEIHGSHLLIAGRLRQGLDTRHAQERIDALFAAKTGRRPVVRELRQVFVESSRSPLIGSAVVISLLLATAIAHLLQRRFTSAEGGCASRVPPRLVRGLEAVLVVGLAAWAGLAIAGHGADWLATRLLGGQAALFDLRADHRVYAVALGLATVVLVLLLVRALRARSSIRSWEQSGLVTLQVAVAMVLVFAAVSPLRLLVTALVTPPGYDATRLQAADVSLAKYRDWTQRRAAIAVLAARLRELPAVEAVTHTHAFPMLDRYWTMSSRAIARGNGRWEKARFAIVGAGYHATMQIPLLAGRAFSATDGPDGRDVVIVNEAFARRGFPGGNAIGAQLEFPDGGKRFEIVGIVGNVRQDGPHEPAAPVIYRPAAQFAGAPRVTLVVRGDVDPAAIAATIDAVDPELSLGAPRTGAEIVAAARGVPRFQAFALGMSAGLAVLLALHGIVGLASRQAERFWRRDESSRLQPDAF